MYREKGTNECLIETDQGVDPRFREDDIRRLPRPFGPRNDIISHLSVNQISHLFLFETGGRQ